MAVSGIVLPDETVLRFFMETFSADDHEPLLAAKKVTSQVKAWLRRHPNAEEIQLQQTQSQSSDSTGYTKYWYTILLTCYLKENVERRPLGVRLQEKRQ